MVKMIYVFRHPKGLSRKKGQAHWRLRHGQLVEKHASLLGIKRYVQLHTSRSPFNTFLRMARNTMKPFDGMEEYWLDRDVMASALDTDQGMAAMKEIVDDEKRFIDFSDSAIWLAEDHVLIPGEEAPENIKNKKRLTWAGSPLPNLSGEEFQSYYLDNHGPLVRGFADVMGMKTYKQIHTLKDPLNVKLRSFRNTQDPFLVSASFIWDFGSMFSLKNQKMGKKARELIAEDERKFIDFPSSAIWLAEEHIVFS